MAVQILPVIQRKDPQNEFEILKQIGSGTYGEVHKVSLSPPAQPTSLRAWVWNHCDCFVPVWLTVHAHIWEQLGILAFNHVMRTSV